MDDKSRQDLNSRILAAQQKRNNLGLTAAQLNQLGGRGPGHSTSAFRGPMPRKVVRSDISRKLPKKPQLKDAPFKKDSIFLSGGIGDIFAVESFMSDQDRMNLTTIFYGTQKSREIMEAWEALPNYPNLKKHIVVWDDFSKFWCFFSIQDCVHRILEARKPQPMNLRRVQDYSIIPIFERIKRGNLQYHGSSFIDHTVAEVDRFDLPEKFISVCPFSTDKRVKDRDFDEGDWKELIRFLKATGLKGVVLNKGGDTVPDVPEVVSLNNETTMPEAIEILKKSCGYIGIDSSLSVLAAKLFSFPYLMVKSRNKHLYDNAACYYAPQTDMKFIMRSIQAPQTIPPFETTGVPDGQSD